MSVAGAVVPGTPRTVHGSQPRKHGTGRDVAAVPGPDEKKSIYNNNSLHPTHEGRGLREEHIELTSEKKSLSCAPRAAR